MLSFIVAFLAASTLAQSSNPPIPGLFSGIGRGYDVVQALSKAPIVQFTFDQGLTWPNPYMQYAMQAYPDQTYITNMPGTKDTMDVTVYSSYTDFEKTTSKWISADVSFGISGVNVGVGFSRAKSEYNKLSNNNTRNLAIQNRLESLYKVDIWPGTEPGPQFTAMVNRLPKKYDADAYNQFIMAFGTHWVRSTVYGSFLNFTVAFDKSLSNTYSTKWEQQQISLTLQYGAAKAGIHDGKNSTTKQVNNTFAQHSGTYNTTAGGDPSVFEASGYDAWLATIPPNPAMLMPHTTMQPLHELIEDETISANLKQALVAYINDPNPEKLEVFSQEVALPLV